MVERRSDLYSMLRDLNPIPHFLDYDRSNLGTDNI
jgi:hypothetical protein